MKKWLLVLIVLVPIVFCGCQAEEISQESSYKPDNDFILPLPRLTGPLSLEEALEARRSIREFTSEQLDLQELSQLLWAAQGITSPTGGRTAPSAGGLYPLQIYVITAGSDGLPAGSYNYHPQRHSLSLNTAGDLRKDLSEAALGQKAVEKGALDVVIVGIYERAMGKYGERGIRYVHMEAGHVAQNITLQAISLNLGSVTIGAFDDDKITKLLALPETETPLYVIPIGHPLT